MFKQIFVPATASGESVQVRPENFGSDPKMAEAWARVNKVVMDDLEDFEMVSFEKAYNFFDYRLYGFTIYCRQLEG